MFIRFVTEARTKHGSRREGFLQAAVAALKHSETPGYAVTEIQTLKDWFNTYLDEPERFNRGPTRTGYSAKTTGLSWFRASATEHISKAFDLCAVLRELGHQITVLKTDRPGFIVYEDSYQIVAEPFSDTPR